ncbi:MAG: type II toxin-antitoxin system VapC family toxin [Acidobacteriota bacterium]|nr:type II toxin-antitoxin system VapC family toxin [Acidobacteriota bacterium]
MIALDTNILVRLITRDDPGQTRGVDALLSTPDETFFLPDIVLAELAWVLARSYGFSRAEIAEVLTALLDRLDVVFEDEELVRAAVRSYIQGLDLADGLILGKAWAAGCSGLASFDESFLRCEPAFVRRPR